MSFRRYFWGLLIIGFGILFLLDNLQVLDFGQFVSRFWPVIIIFFGILIIFGKRPNRVYVDGDINAEVSEERIQLTHTFGDVRLKIDSSDFEGGVISNVFGNIEVDLEGIGLKEGEHNLRLDGVFGDLIVILPKKVPTAVIAYTSFGTTRIKDKSSYGVSGKISHKSEGFDSAVSKLTITAHQTFGDVRVF